MSDNLPDVAETIKELRAHEMQANRFGEFQSVYSRAASLLESLSARVTQAETELAKERGRIASSAYLQKLVRKAWWRGVTDQWKHRPIGNRIPETLNPYEIVEIPS